MSRPEGGVCRAVRERGAIASEYLAVLVLSAIVVGAAIFTMSPAGSDVRATVCQTVSDVIQEDLACADDGSADGSDGSDDGSETDADEPVDDSAFEPDKCKLHQRGDEYSAVVKIGFIEIGENAGFVVTEYSDGTVTMMATNGSEIGATGGFGADAAWGQLEAGAKVDFGAGLEFDYGSTWTFESMEQAESFRDQLDDYLYDQWAMTHPVCHGMVCVQRPLLGADPPPVPSTTFGGVKLTGEIEGELGISATTGTAPLTQAEMTQQGVVASLSPSANWVVTNDNNGTPDDPSDDTRTYVTDMEINAELTGQIGLATGGAGAVAGMSYSVKKDAQGRIIEIQITTTSEVTTSGGGDASGEVNTGGGTDGERSGGGGISSGTTDGDVVVTETTLALDPENAEQQQIVTDWMGGSGDFTWPGLIPLAGIDPSKADPDDPFATLLFENATSSTVAYDEVTDTQGFALNVKFGMAFGADFSTTQSEATATEATYLGAPRPDGTRPVIDYTECVT